MHATPSPLTHAPDQIYVDRFQDSIRLLIRRQDGRPVIRRTRL